MAATPTRSNPGDPWLLQDDAAGSEESMQEPVVLPSAAKTTASDARSPADHRAIRSILTSSPTTIRVVGRRR